MLHAQLYSVCIQQMSAQPPPVVPRKPQGVRVLIPRGEQIQPGVLSIYEKYGKGKVSIGISIYYRYKEFSLNLLHG